MGLYKYIRKAFAGFNNKEEQKKRLILWRKQNTTTRVEHPTRLDRARSLAIAAVQSSARSYGNEDHALLRRTTHAIPPKGGSP